MKKNLALLLIVCLLLGMMAGCGSGPQENPAADENPNAEPPAAPEEASGAADSGGADTPEEEPEEKPSDGWDTYSGAVPASESSIAYPITEKDVTLSFWTPFQSNMPDVYSTITDIPALDVIADNVGITVDWIVVSGMDMFIQFNMMAAGGEYYDMMEAAVECYSGGAIGALDDGVLADLTDYIEENAPDYLQAHASRGSSKDIITGDGRYACLWGAYDLPEVSQGYVIRKDWLDELNLDIPVTYDDYFNVLSAFKDAYGCSDAFLMGQRLQDESHTPGGFGVSGYVNDNFGTNTDLFQIDGTVKCSFIETGYQDYLREINRWFEAGLFSSDFPSISSRANDDQRVNRITSGNTGIWGLGASNISIFEEAIGGGAELIGIADPVLNPGDINHFSTAETVNSKCDVSVSSTCKNIEAALQYLNYYFTNEGIMYYNYGIEGETYNLVDGEVVYTDLIMNPVEGYTSFTMTEAYVLVGGIASVTYANRQLDFSGDNAREAWVTWNTCSDRQNVLPEGIALTAEETSEVAALQSDIYTYVSETLPRFVMGTLDIDSDWDDFTSTVKSMGIEDIIDIYQGALDRYNAL